MQILRKIAFPISLVYIFIIYIRNLCYDIGVFRSTSFKTPIVCIGNLSVGGTGKTPMIEFVLQLVKQDYKVAILSRGYRRKSKGYLLAKETSTVEDLGDEPFQIYSKYKPISLAVDSDRRNGILNLENQIAPDVILLDDAFQHRKVKPKLSILLTTFSDLYVNDWYLPTGNLRDSKKEARRASIIIVTKCPDEITETKKKSIISLIKPKKYQKVLFSKFVYGDYLIGLNKKIPLEDLKGKQFSLVTGIANPEPLVTYLKTINVHSFKHFEYADHHFFSSSEIANFSKNELIVTTEKDFTKLSGRCDNLFYIEVRHIFFDDGKAIIQKEIEDIMPIRK